MDQDTFDRYLTECYYDQITWYGDKASRNKLLYTIFQWGVIALSATVPALIASLPAGFKWIPIIVAIVLAIATAGLKTFKFQENWINYRTISETLKKEKHFYDANLYDYGDAEDKEAVFVKRVELLISIENSLWVTIHKQKEDEKKKA